jgi:hypothetical protein
MSKSRSSITPMTGEELLDRIRGMNRQRARYILRQLRALNFGAIQPRLIRPAMIVRGTRTTQ